MNVLKTKFYVTEEILCFCVNGKRWDMFLEL